MKYEKSDQFIVAMKRVMTVEQRDQHIIHLVNKETLKEQHKKQQNNKASGIDRITKEEYNKDLENNLDQLIIRMKKFSYKPLPVRRTYIPKGNGKLRPLEYQHTKISQFKE